MPLLPSALPPKGEARRYATNDFLNLIALPPLGKGDRVSGARVLSLIVDLRCISSLSFIPLSPSNLRPFRAPPSKGRREHPREPLPLEGAAERSEAGVGFLFCGEAAT